MTNDLQFQMEMLSFGEKIALAELEASKASERVKELEYQRARFQMEFIKAITKQQEEMAKAQNSQSK